MFSKDHTDHAPIARPTPEYFCYPAPDELRDLLFRAIIDSLQLRGYIAKPLEGMGFPVEGALQILHASTADPDERLTEMLAEIESEKAAASDREAKGLPNPLRPDEVATMTPKACMSVMCGLFWWSAGHEEHECNCMLEAGEFIACLYGTWDDDAGPQADMAPIAAK